MPPRRPPADRPAPVPVDTLVDAPRSTMLTEPSSIEITDRVPRARGLVDGAIVDRYVVLSHLGSGGMGAVYAAWDQQLGRRVALKLLHPGPMATAAHGERLRREARALARLNHEHVVRVFDVGEWDGSPWITMEYVDGQDIDAWVQARRPPREAIVRLFMEAARGLAAAHALGIIHRDVKGQNILVGSDGRVRVGDFGIATFSGDGDEPPRRPVAHDEISLRNRVTLDGTVLGTPGYMAPEQLEGTDVDARCDQFAFCVALWRAVFDEDPFPSPDAILARFERMRAPPQTPRRRWPALEQVLARGLRFDVAARHKDMQALHDALADVLRRPRRIALGAAVVAVAVLGATGAVAAVRHDPCGLRAAGAAILAPLTSASPSSSPLLQAALSPWVERWTTSAIAVCRQDGLEDEVRAARLRCFDVRRQDATALVALVADGRVTDDAAVQAALALPPPASCLDDRQVAPSDPDSTAALAAARMALLAGEPAAAEAAAAPTLARARTRGHDAVVADAAHLVGQAAMHRGGLAEAEAAFRDGIAAAMSSGAARTEAMLWTSLVELLGDRFKRRDEARSLVPWMQAAVQRFPDDIDLQCERLVVAALMANESDDRRRGAALATSAFEIALRREPVSPHAVARATNLRALLLAASGEQQAAIAALREGVEIMRRSLPEHHIRFMALHNTLGLALRRAGDLDGARRAFLDAVTVAERQRRPADHAAIHGVPLINLAALDLVAGDIASAQDRGARAHALLVGSIGQAGDRVSYADELLALVAAADRRVVDAARHAADMVARHATREPGGLLHTRGVVLAAAVEVEASPAAARAKTLAAVRARLARHTMTNDAARASLALGRAALALVAGDREEARVFLAAADASAIQHHGSAEERDLAAGLHALVDDGSVALVPSYLPLGRLVRESDARRGQPPRRR